MENETPRPSLAATDEWVKVWADLGRAFWWLEKLSAIISATPAEAFKGWPHDPYKLLETVEQFRNEPRYFPVSTAALEAAAPLSPRLPSITIHYQRAPEYDKRIARGDDYAGDAFVRWVAVGQEPDDAHVVHEARSHTEQQGWIPVSDRLPASIEHVCILISDKDSAIENWATVGYLHSGKDWWAGRPGNYDRLEGWVVTHWMPLPNKPGETAQSTRATPGIEAPGCAHCMGCADPKCPAKELFDVKGLLGAANNALSHQASLLSAKDRELAEMKVELRQESIIRAALQITLNEREAAPSSTVRTFPYGISSPAAAKATRPPLGHDAGGAAFLLYSFVYEARWAALKTGEYCPLWKDVPEVERIGWQTLAEEIAQRVAVSATGEKIK